MKYKTILYIFVGGFGAIIASSHFLVLNYLFSMAFGILLGYIIGERK